MPDVGMPPKITLIYLGPLSQPIWENADENQISGEI
jgi:hypothetical protein